VDPQSGKTLLARDESVRADTTAEGLSALAPSFAALGATPVGPGGETLDRIALAAYPEVRQLHHVHTAGNSSGLADGAGLVVVASERFVKETGVRPRARIRAMTTIGSEPVIMLTAPGPVSESCSRPSASSTSTPSA
jgi:acetyl-CoA C-acetyltransferase